MANNNNFFFIRLFLFFALRRLYLYISFNMNNLSNIIIYKQINKKKTINILESI